MAARGFRLPGGLHAALGPSRPPARARPANCTADPRGARHGARAPGEPVRSRPHRRRVPAARGREWRRPAARGQFRPCPLALDPASPSSSDAGEKEVTSGRSRRRSVVGGRAGPARWRRLPQCPPPHCFPSRRLPAKPSPGTRKFPGATPPAAAAMETAPAFPRAARPGPRLHAAGPARLTGRQQSPPRPRQAPPSWRGQAAPSFPAARALLPRSRRARSRRRASRRGRAPSPSAGCGFCGPGSAPGLLQSYRWQWTSAVSDTWERPTEQGHLLHLEPNCFPALRPCPLHMVSSWTQCLHP